MLKIRFLRTGRKKQPFYKIVVTDKNNPPSSGRFKESVGFYDPLTKDCRIDGDKVINWMEKGAQPTDVVYNLLIKKGILKGKKKDVVSLTNKRREKIEGQKAEAEAKKKEAEEVKEEEVNEVESDVVNEAEVESEVKEESVASEEPVVEEKVDPEVKEESAETQEKEVEEDKK